MKNNKKPALTKLSITAQCAIAFTLLYLTEFCSLLLGKEITSWGRHSTSSRPLEEGPLSISEAFERMETTGMVYLSLFVLIAIVDVLKKKEALVGIKGEGNRHVGVVCSGSDLT